MIGYKGKTYIKGAAYRELPPIYKVATYIEFLRELYKFCSLVFLALIIYRIEIPPQGSLDSLRPGLRSPSLREA